MGNLDHHSLHQLIRSWLLAENPYGMNQGGQIEPMMGRAGGTGGEDVQAALKRGDPRAHGEKAVEAALAPGARTEPTVSGETAHAAGTAAVEGEMDRANTEAWQAKMQGRKADRARAGKEGRAAVADATRPAAVRAMIAAQQAQPQWVAPEESAGWASAVGQSAVEGARPPPQGPSGWYPPVGKGRLKDPENPDARPPE